MRQASSDHARTHVSILPCVQGKAAANGVAAINSIGSIGGFIGPYLLGALQARPQSQPSGSALFLACCALAGGLETAQHTRVMKRCA